MDRDPPPTPTIQLPPEETKDTKKKSKARKRANTHTSRFPKFNDQLQNRYLIVPQIFQSQKFLSTNRTIKNYNSPSFLLLQPSLRKTK